MNYNCFMPYHIIKEEREKFKIKGLNVERGERKNNIYTYEFSKWYEGRRYRKQIRVLSSLVEKVYKKWLEKVFIGKVEKKVYRLKECLELYKKYCEKNKSVSENGKINLALNLFIIFFKANKNIEEIKIIDMDKFCFFLAEKYKNVNSYNRMLVVINAFFNFLRKRDIIIPKSIMEGRRKKAVKKGMVLLGEEDYYKIINLCKEEYQKTFINLAFFTGMRHQEILSLKWEDIFLKEKFIKLKAENTKAKKSRVIPIIPFLENFLIKLKKDGEYVVSNLGKKLSTFRKKWKLITEKLNMSFAIHDLRHHFITLLFTAGVNPREIQEIAGHATLSQTMEYAEISGEYQKKRANNIGGLIDDIWTSKKNQFKKIKKHIKI